MASTPSTSALTAVLRCRGNIWTRNPPTKRPATSVYSLGLAGGSVCDSPAERTRSRQVPPWESFLRGERLVLGGRLTIQYNGRTLRETDPRETDDRDPKLPRALAAEDAHSAAQLVRQLALRLTCNLHGADKCSQITRAIRRSRPTRVCKIIFVQGASGQPVLKVSVTSPCGTERAGPIADLGSAALTALRNACLSLAALASDALFCKPAVMYSRRNDAPQRWLRQQSAKNKNALQANGQTPTDTDKWGSGGELREDRPD
ncbi:uncharacterized protein ACBR49_005459 [Aulostomus maculatus]